MGFLRWANGNRALVVGCTIISVGMLMHSEDTWGLGLLLLVIAAFS